MAMLFLEAIGPRGEELALAAGESTGIPVGFDPDLKSATFDADGLDDAELLETVVAALESSEPDWRSHLSVSD